MRVTAGATASPGMERNEAACSFVMLPTNFKVFTKAMSTLARLGEVANVEPTPEGLLVRVLNHSATAYGIFLFSTHFFCELNTDCLGRADDDNSCRMPMKAALLSFKPAYAAGHKFVTCEFRIDPRADNLQMEIEFIHDIRRLFLIPLLPQKKQKRRAIDRKQLANHICVAPAFLLEIIDVLECKSDEVALGVKTDKVVMRNYVSGRSALVKSETTLTSEQCVRFEITREHQLAFGVSEFKSILCFANQQGASVDLYFDQGKPLVVTIEGDVTYSAEFYLATLDPEQNADASLINDVAADVPAASQRQLQPEDAHSSFGDSPARSARRSPQERASARLSPENEAPPAKIAIMSRPRSPVPCTSFYRPTAACALNAEARIASPTASSASPRHSQRPREVRIEPDQPSQPFADAPRLDWPLHERQAASLEQRPSRDDPPATQRPSPDDDDDDDSWTEPRRLPWTEEPHSDKSVGNNKSRGLRYRQSGDIEDDPAFTSLFNQPSPPAANPPPMPPITWSDPQAPLDDDSQRMRMTELFPDSSSPTSNAPANDESFRSYFLGVHDETQTLTQIAQETQRYVYANSTQFYRRGKRD